MRQFALLALTASIVLALAGCGDRDREPAPHKPTPGAGSASNCAVTFELWSSGLPNDGMWKCQPELVDINHDARPDLLALPRQGDGPHIWINDGDGDWRDTASGLKFDNRSCGGGLAVADLNGDGNRDLVVGDHCSGLYVYLGDGQNNWELVASKFAPTAEERPKAESFIGAESVALGDLDGDGKLDLAVGAADQGGVLVFKGDGAGRNWTYMPTSLPIEGWCLRVVLHDINRDGNLDLLANTEAGLRVWLGDGHGKLTWASDGIPETMARGIFQYGLAIGDINEDGLPDVAISNWIDGAEVYCQQPDNTWKKSEDVFPQSRGGATGVALGDVDADGHLDLIISGRLQNATGNEYGLYLLRGDGRGGFTYQPDCGLPRTGLSMGAGVEAADVDGDGRADIIATSGLITATGPGPAEPVVDKRVMVYRTIPR